MITTQDLARQLNVSHRTIEGWRYRQKFGPPSTAFSVRCVRYEVGEIETWLLSRPRIIRRGDVRSPEDDAALRRRVRVRVGPAEAVRPRGKMIVPIYKTLGGAPAKPATAPEAARTKTESLVIRNPTGKLVQVPETWIENHVAELVDGGYELQDPSKRHQAIMAEYRARTSRPPK